MLEDGAGDGGSGTFPAAAAPPPDRRLGGRRLRDRRPARRPRRRPQIARAAPGARVTLYDEQAAPAAGCTPSRAAERARALAAEARAAGVRLIRTRPRSVYPEDVAATAARA